MQMCTRLCRSYDQAYTQSLAVANVCWTFLALALLFSVCFIESAAFV